MTLYNVDVDKDHAFLIACSHTIDYQNIFVM